MLSEIVVMVIIAVIGSADGNSISVETTEVSIVTCEAMQEQAANPPTDEGIRYGDIALTVYCLPRK